VTIRTASLSHRSTTALGREEPSEPGIKRQTFTTLVLAGGRHSAPKPSLTMVTGFTTIMPRSASLDEGKADTPTSSA
jgi:hypothetical protein